MPHVTCKSVLILMAYIIPNGPATMQPMVGRLLSQVEVSTIERLKTNRF